MSQYNLPSALSTPPYVTSRHGVQRSERESRSFFPECSDTLIYFSLPLSPYIPESETRIAESYISHFLTTYRAPPRSTSVTRSIFRFSFATTVKTPRPSWRAIPRLLNRTPPLTLSASLYVLTAMSVEIPPNIDRGLPAKSPLTTLRYERSKFSITARWVEKCIRSRFVMIPLPASFSMPLLISALLKGSMSPFTE